jgi:hypothetical protein
MADDVYHVTFTKNLSDIQERGLDPLSQSLWAKQETGERYQQEPSVYGFTNPEDALNWAGKMKWDFRDEAGESGDYSIIRLKGGEHWEDDPSGDFRLTGHGGKSVRYQGHINPEDVVSITQLPEPARLNEEFEARVPGGSYEEWIKYYGDQLRELPMAEPPPTEPRSTALVPSATATSAEGPTKKQTRMKTGIGALMKKGFWPGRIIGALEQGWDTLSDEQKTEITEFMNKPMHELVGLPPPPDLGIGSYLRDLLGMASEEEITESRIQAHESREIDQADRADITQVASALQKDGWTESHRSTKDGVVTSYYFDPPRGLKNEYGEPMGEIRISDHELGRTVYGEEQGGQWEVDIKINPSMSVDDHLRAIMNEEYRETAGGLGSVGFQEWSQRAYPNILDQEAAEDHTLPEGGIASLFTEDEISIATSTARSAGAVGPQALVPRTVREVASPDDTILDFGSGPEEAHAQKLREDGFNVTAWDFGKNPEALYKQYDIVYASNVLNVQSSLDMLERTVRQIADSVRPGGTVVVNLPLSPRKSPDLNPKTLETILSRYFADIQRVAGKSNAPVYTAIRKAPEVVRKAHGGFIDKPLYDRAQ